MNLANRVRGKLCKNVDAQNFIPDTAINELTSVDTVQKYLESVLQHDSSHPSIVELVKYVTNQTEPAKKVFLILVLCGHLEHLSLLFQAGFSDRHLPIECDWNSTNERYDVRTRPEPQTHGDTSLAWDTFGGWPAEHVASFAENQWIFLAPVFTPGLFDFDLPQRCPFPILEKHDRSKRGFSGSVYEVNIHKDHMQASVTYSYPNRNISHKRHHQIELGTKSIAMKELLPNMHEYYLKEAASLRLIRELKHGHLIQPLAAYRRGSSGVCGFLLPWAEGGNLEEFWKRPTKRAAGDPELMTWTLNQLRGLCGATEALHLNNCRHTDLKPLNILLFHEGDYPGTLRIADVGLAKIHDDITGQPQPISNAKSGSVRYEPPEFCSGERLSRVFDVWSLGCVFLEFLTWAVYGWKRLQSFIRHTNRFWEGTDDEPQQHSEVKRLIEEMRRHLKTNGTESALTQCLDLVARKMLVPDWELRENMSSLRHQFDLIREQQKGADYDDDSSDGSLDSLFSKASFASTSASSQPSVAEDSDLCDELAQLLLRDEQIQASLRKARKRHDYMRINEQVHRILMKYLLEMRQSTHTPLYRGILDDLVKLERQQKVTELTMVSSNGREARDEGEANNQESDDEEDDDEVEDEEEVDDEKGYEDESRHARLEERLRNAQIRPASTEVAAKRTDEVGTSEQRIPLHMVEDYFSSGQPFQSLKARLEYLVNRPNSLSNALATGSVGMIAIFLERRFHQAATGDYQWLVDLKDMGYSELEMADLLYQKFHDFPWIYFDSKLISPSNPALETPVDGHLEYCAHVSFRRDVTERGRLYKSHVSLDRGRDAREIFEELCGLAGIVPDSRDSSQWNGTVSFDENDGGLAATISHSMSQHARNSSQSILTRLLHVAERNLAAAAILQQVGLCCDSFTLLMAFDATQTESCRVRLRRFDFGLFKMFASELRHVQENLGHDTMGDENIVDAALSKLWRLSSGVIDPFILTVKESSSVDSDKKLEETTSVVSLSLQLLSVGLLSYMQGHIGELHPFFLDTPLQNVILGGLNSASDTPYQPKAGMKACLTRLTCLDEMVGDQVLVFHPLSYAPDVETCFDVVATLEDVLDTWGPGTLVHQKSHQNSVVAVALRGGFIGRTLSGNGPSTHHWDHNIDILDLARPLNLQDEITIGSPFQANLSCNNRPADCQRACRLFYLGTSGPYLESSQFECGMEIGPDFLKGSFVKAFKRVPPVTIKRLQGDSTTDCGMLVQDLDEYWGIRVSYCTGLAQRVRLRNLVGDLFPQFAKAFPQFQDIATLESLESKADGIADKFNGPSVTLETLRKWLGTLSKDEFSIVSRVTALIFQKLSRTGISACGRFLSVAWPKDAKVDVGVRIELRDDYPKWLSILKDTDTCTTFAYISNVCLTTNGFTCCEQAGEGVYKLPLLETAVLCQSTSFKTCVHLKLQHKQRYYFDRLGDLPWWVEAEKLEQATNDGETTTGVVKPELPAKLVRLDKMKMPTAIAARLKRSVRPTPDRAYKIVEHFADGQKEAVWILSERA